ncbi:MAG: DUF131 domain-containing protein [Metallosphaera yellowstonensis]|jgi:uncharacterized membrane protein|uniref:TIGR00304 family membrane protein n=1 Tax=Metallosphaera yellowstonensis TaxID=1111107 RepID=UPI00064F41EB|nr:DUF131 domain-containing protein [Metallosphaera yellowstonensis]
MRLTIVGLVLIFVGFGLLFASTVSVPTNSTVGGVVLIGPVPIVFGRGYTGTLLPFMLIGLAFTVIALLFFLVSILAFRGSARRTD